MRGRKQTALARGSRAGWAMAQVEVLGRSLCDRLLREAGAPKDPAAKEVVGEIPRWPRRAPAHVHQ